MDEKLPDDFDVIVIGTGLPESIISSALSRIGKRVLHLDHNKHYGGSWSSFNLQAFESWIKDDSSNEDCCNSGENDFADKINQETETLIAIDKFQKTIDSREMTCYLPHAKVQSGSKEDINEVSATDEKQDQQVASVSEQAVSPQEPQQKLHAHDVIPAQEPASCGIETEANLMHDEDLSSEKGDGHVVVEKIDESSGKLIKSPDNINKVVQEFDKHTWEYFHSKWRHYNLDIFPKLMFSRGKLVELLITSNVCRYLEFRNVTRTLTLLDDGSDVPKKLAPVPCSRTDVFSSKFISMIEKRTLMRVLTICANFENHSEEYKDYENRPFVDFLADKKLSKKLQHFILHSIALVTEDSDTMNGLKATQKFLKSLGRYGNSAFLWPLYGVGELPQAFCRLGAVFGGTFCLNRSLQAIITDKANGKCIGIIDSTGQRISCQNLILDECHTPESCRILFTKTVARAIYITDSTLLPADGENVSLITIPPTAELPAARFIEVGHSCCVCPSKYHVVHGIANITTAESESPVQSARSRFSKLEDILFNCIKSREEEVESAVNDENGSPENDAHTQTEELRCEGSVKPNVLWAAYFNMNGDGVVSTLLPDNVYVMKGPSIELGFDDCVSEAQLLFKTLCPEEEFLPRAPNPDEIIYFDQDDDDAENIAADVDDEPEVTGDE